MTDAAHCEAKLHGFRRTQEGVVVSFVLHPAEIPQALALDPLGTRYMLAFAAIGNDEQPVPSAGKSQQPQPKSLTRPPLAEGAHKTPAERAVIRAALLPRDIRFQAWANGCANEDEAAQFIRKRCCDGNTRRLIASVPEYLDRFMDMETAFKMDVGEMARPR